MTMFRHIDARSTGDLLRDKLKIFYGHMPIIKGTVLFESFWGMYNDNPRYVSEELHAAMPEARIIWVKSGKNCEAFPDYVETVQFQSPEYYEWLYRANVIVDNMAGVRHHAAYTSRLRKFFSTFVQLAAPLRKRGQYNISTWHGTPLKRLGQDRFDLPKSDIARRRGSCDCMLAGCTFTRDALKSAHFKEFDVKFKMYGSPRNDILFKNIDGAALKKKLGLPDKKVVLYAPTFRDDSVENSGAAQLEQFDFTALEGTLKARFGGDWCFVFRVHHTVVDKIDAEKIAENHHDCHIINGNLGDDMAEYLACTDILITDYSSSMFDFALTMRPCFLYVPDREHYERDVRGVYFPMDELPFAMAGDFEKLLKAIAGHDREDYRADVQAFLKKLGNVEDGNASRRTAEDIIKFLKTGVKD